MKISRTIPIFLIATILVFGTTISMGIPASFAQSYEDSYAKDKKTSNLNKQNVNCNNIIINGVNSAGQGSGGDMINDMTNDDGGDGTGQWLENGNDKKPNSINENIVNFCKNKHNKIVVVTEQEPEEPPTTPTTGSLTVKKEIYGCDDIEFDEILDNIFVRMNCSLPDGDPKWTLCDDLVENNVPNTDIFCAPNLLQEDEFDIEVSDDSAMLIDPPGQFKGSTEGKMIMDLEPGTYNVQEIKHGNSDNQLGANPPTESNCRAAFSFDDGGVFANNEDDGQIVYTLCFEYEDENGEDCSSIDLQAGDDKTCTVKNYISSTGSIPFPE